MLPSAMFSSCSSSFPPAAPSLHSSSPIFASISVTSVTSALNSPSFFPLNAASTDSLPAAKAPLTSLESALTQGLPVTPLECALTKNKDLKSFRIRTYRKTGGGGLLVCWKCAGTLPLKWQTGEGLIGGESSTLHRRLRFRILLRSSLGGGALKRDGSRLFAWRFALRDFS